MLNQLSRIAVVLPGPVLQSFDSVSELLKLQRQRQSGSRTHSQNTFKAAGSRMVVVRMQLRPFGWQSIAA